jgi:hydroxyacyl-ACP dehydratase HTD2-like protein with hotdog domain
VPSTALLFRYSALTFNTHRIHYDAPYAEQVERYRPLVQGVHLMAVRAEERIPEILSLAGIPSLVDLA